MAIQSNFDLAFALGDYLAGALVGLITAVGVHRLVGPMADMVLAMIVGMAVGMTAHLFVGLLFTPLLGAFHAMIPGGLIGMYGGMLFAMRDAMQQQSNGRSAWIGVAFGLLLVAATQVYDRALRDVERAQD